MTADILRQKFLDFFQSKKHKVVESDSLVPRDDPTVLFTPAGMNQFKKQFMGIGVDYKRAASSQRCLRTDDLDKVGKTPVHHTFFEMLGNFSFGDYFKAEAISWAWEFLTKELKIDKDRLWVSVYKDDDEAYAIWKDKIGLTVERIVKLGDHDNFWPADAKEKGPNGPCGPCSEIFFDFGKNVGCQEKICDPSCSCGRFAEIWNLVFTQFNRIEGGLLEPLPKKNIDTGMGLERLTAVMQGVTNNFATELFQPLIKEIKRHNKNDNQGAVFAITDHLRAIVFAIYDGVLPSNESRGYVIRKLIRKSTLLLRSIGIEQPFLYKLVPVLAEIMKVPYPELKTRRENIAEIILNEEKNFIHTLNSSQDLFKDKFKALLKNGNPQDAGIIAFQLYDTYGIPFELTKDWLKKNNLKVSLEAFHKELEAQKSRSKSQSTMKGDVFDFQHAGLNVKATTFLGYAKFQAKAKILKIIKDNKEIKIILDKTPFYAQSGGQLGDSGEIKKGKNIFQVEDTQKIEKVIVHFGKVKTGTFKIGDEVLADVNMERRLAIARNHTATHLLQAALRKILGAHVKQQGSLVAAEKLRFDFTHFKDLGQEELNRIEEEVNNYIMENHKLSSRQMELAQAKKSGALAFFGEKYADKVRMVTVSNFSKELCGGTHLDYTGQIGLFKIIHEGSIASGVRRIEAITGKEAYKFIKNQEEALDKVSSVLATPKENVCQELGKKMSQIRELERQLISQKSANLKNSLSDKEHELINGIKFVVHIDKDRDSIRRAVDLIKEKEKENTIIASSTGNNLTDQVFWAIGVTADLCQKGIDASRLIKEIASDIGGNGGGRKDFAQAGGNNPASFDTVRDKIRNLIKELK